VAQMTCSKVRSIQPEKLCELIRRQIDNLGSIKISSEKGYRPLFSVSTLSNKNFIPIKTSERRQLFDIIHKSMYCDENIKWE
jgi:hypothetical protein